MNIIPNFIEEVTLDLISEARRKEDKCWHSFMYEGHKVLAHECKIRYVWEVHIFLNGISIDEFDVAFREFNSYK